MKTYKVIYGQNIFDVALKLYGSIEGLFGLLIANPGLGVSSVLEEGDELMYLEDWQINPSIVSYYQENNIVPANGTYNLNKDSSATDPFAIIYGEPECSRIYMDVTGSGVIHVYWGDGKSLEKFTLSSSPTSISHWFPNITSEKIIKMYGNPTINSIKIKTGRGELRFLRQISLQQYVNNSQLRDTAAKLLIKYNE